MRIDTETHKKMLLALLGSPALVLQPDQEKSLEDGAKDYLALLEAVRNAEIAKAD
jgi:hypothetical protein